MDNKFMNAEDAVKLIKDGDSVCISGFVSMGNPVELSRAVCKRFKEMGSPKNITLIAGAGMNISDEWAMQGLVSVHIGTHIGLEPNFQRMIHEENIEAYFYPYGVFTHLLRAISGKKPGILTKIGLGTFFDPDFGGGKMNNSSERKIVEKLKLRGDEYLLYYGFPVNVALIKGTTSDEKGNITIEKEPLSLDFLSSALAAKAHGGVVIAQVERVTKRPLNPKDVKVPGIIVDAVVVAKPENHWQSSVEQYNPALSGEIVIPLGSLVPMELNERKIICRRALMELTPKSIVNLGIGMPEGCGVIASEEGLSEEMSMLVEAGPIGGVPLSGGRFGSAINAEAILDLAYQLDLIDSGLLDLAILGLAQVDERGNVNVSKFGPRIIGAGGFVNITQNTSCVVFCGTMTAGGLEISIKDQRITIIKEGKVKKFVKEVEQITFSGEFAKKNSQKVLYITERAVFQLKNEGITLIEVAPGVNIEKDIIQNMSFRPIISDSLKYMDPRLFSNEPMGIREEIISKR